MFGASMQMLFLFRTLDQDLQSKIFKEEHYIDYC